MQRGGGVIMHITSLPGPFGIGVMGEEAVAFAKQLRDQGMKYWQVLPFTYPGMGNSPYQSFSAFAGNWLLLDPRRLMKMGLLTGEDVVSAEYNVNKWRIDYDYLRGQREQLLRTAYSRISDRMRGEVCDFAKKNKWADEVALYQTIKNANGQKAWWQWEDEALKDHDAKALAKLRGSDEYYFHAFVQYLFIKEWTEVKAAVNECGISIIGDMPIYVSCDSADVWAARDMFKMASAGRRKKLDSDYAKALKEDEKARPPKETAYVFEKVAGVPPDYFSAEGQLWGNPIYDWDKMKEDGYSWWMDRIEESYKLYDYLRIDHFRAFCSYWEVDSDADTAKEGEWVKGPGLEFFKKVDKKFGGRERLIAEDLGEWTPDLEEFLANTGIPGMRIMEFAFNPGDNSTYLPHNYDSNCIAFTGTHDNNTLLGWLWDSSEEVRRCCLEYCGFQGDNWGEGGTRSPSCRAIIRTLWMSHANVVMIPVQDMLGYGADTRMNIPGTADGNWVVRFTSEDLASVDNGFYKDLNRIYFR
jgi:4-alpha-glucanotransferase